MVEKVAIGDVVKDALGLIRKRFAVYSGGLLLTLAAGVPLMGRAGNEELLFSALTLGIWAATSLIAMAVYLVLFHDSLTTLRGTPKFLPERFMSKYLHLLWKALLFGLMVMGLGFIILIPLAMGIGLIAVVSADAPSFVQPLFLMAMGGISILPMSYFAFRWGFALPAIAVGDESSFRLSWRMTRRHSFRMVVFAVPVGVLNSIYRVINTPQIQAGTFHPFSPANIAFTLLNCIVFWFTCAVFIVWYEKLKTRYEAMSEIERKAE